MTIEIDPEYKIDSRKLQYHEPMTEVSRLVQQPSYLIDGYSLAYAVMKDWKTSKKKENT